VPAQKKRSKKERESTSTAETPKKKGGNQDTRLSHSVNRSSRERRKLGFVKHGRVGGRKAKRDWGGGKPRWVASGKKIKPRGGGKRGDKGKAVEK